MFDLDAGKLVVIGVVALIVIGPKDLPRVLRQVGQTVAKLRRMASDFQAQFMEAMREAELDDIRKDMAALNDATKFRAFDPLQSVRRELTEAMTDRPAIASGPQPALEPPAVPEPPALVPPPGDADPAGLSPIAEPPSEPLPASASFVDRASDLQRETPSSTSREEDHLAAAESHRPDGA